MWKNVVEPDWPQTITEYSIEYMRFSCGITKALIFDNILLFPQQKLLRSRVAMLGYNVHCLSCIALIS